MKAAWYERQGLPADVLVAGAMAAPVPDPGEFIRETYIEPFDISIRSLAESLGSEDPF